MDIASKLKFLLWCFVTGLWALFMYQYIEGDKYRAVLSMRNSPASSVSSAAASGIEPMSENSLPPVVSSSNAQGEFFLGISAPSNDDAQLPAKKSLLMAVPKARIKGKNPFAEIAVSTFSAYDFNTPISTVAYTATGQAIYVPEIKRPEKEMSIETKSVPQETKPHRIQPLAKDISPKDYPDIPSGFQQKVTRHFVLYEEGEVSESLEKFSEQIHGSIMLDLVDFSPWTREKKVFIFYAHSMSSYQALSGRPAWSGGAASLNERRIYLYASKGAYGILAHELTHMYFDSFFPPANPSPLWLSEGMAIFIQSERAASTPEWLKENLKRIRNGAGYKLTDLIRIDDLDGADENNIRLWYAQSYSFTKYLMNIKGNKVFYQFCNLLKDGWPVEQALSIAYSQSLKNLEYGWRYSISPSARKQ